MMKNFALLCTVGTAAAHGSYMIEPSRCSRDTSVGANIMGAAAVASSNEIVMMESFPPQVSVPGVTSGEILFEASVGTFSGDNVGCDGSRAWVRAGGSVTFNAPDSGSYTIRALHAAAHGAVSVAEMTMGGGGGGSSCPEDINQDLTVDVNDLLGMLSGFGGSGADGSDVNGDNLVDVNDLLQLLSAFGSSCTGGGGLISLPPVEVCSGCCPAGAACFAPDPPCCADRAPSCTQGADCGGQVWNDCGTSCPLVCGSPPPQMCNMMCNSAFQCTSASPWWDNTAGQCVAESDCSEVFVLPPGLAIGRPFLTVQETPSAASPLEALSDWMIEL